MKNATMEKLKFKVLISAPKEKVWSTLWEDKTYREWTSAFSAGSYAKGDWKEGSRIQFLNPENNGMYALIAKKIENVQMTFKHLGEIKGGVEQEVKYTNSNESYFLSVENGKTELAVELDAPALAEYKDFFKQVFPKALQLVKQISER